MLLIGSQAAKALDALPRWKAGRVDDTDIRGTREELDLLVSHITKLVGEPTVKESTKFPGKYMVRSGYGTIEYDATMLPSYPLLDDLYDNCTVSLFGLTLKVPSARTLYLMKRSHINFAIHWPKNFKDMISFANHIGLGWRDGWRGIFTEEHLAAYEALREEAFNRYSHTQDRIKLKKSEKEFFGQSSGLRRYVHDDIHWAVAFHSKPMFEMFKTADDSPLLSEKKFVQAHRLDKMYLSIEESMVVGIERFYLPEKRLKPKNVLHAGAAKLLHTMCKGWFQDFGLDHAHMVSKYASNNFIERFENALEKGQIREQ